MESEANAIAKHSNFIKSMNSSFSSQDSNSSFLDNLPDESNRSDSRPHNRQGDMHESFNSSFTSVDSRGSDYGMEPEPEPEPIQHMLQRQQQILQQQLRGVNPNFMGTTLSLNINDSSSSSSNNNSHQVWRDQKMPYVMPGSNAFHSSFSNMNNFSNLQQQQHQRGTGMLGHSSFGDTQQHRGQLSFGNFQNNQQIIPNTMQQFGNSSLQSLQLGDALHGVSNHASDYSSSAPHCQMQSSHSSGFSASFHSGFANSYSSGFQHSDGLAPPSATHDVMQISNHSSNYGMPMHQQQQQQQQQPGNLDRKRSEDVTNTMN